VAANSAHNAPLSGGGGAAADDDEEDVAAAMGFGAFGSSKR
jgi:hypothetical protein